MPQFPWHWWSTQCIHNVVQFVFKRKGDVVLLDIILTEKLDTFARNYLCAIESIAVVLGLQFMVINTYTTPLLVVISHSRSYVLGAVHFHTLLLLSANYSYLGSPLLWSYNWSSLETINVIDWLATHVNAMN